MPMRGGLRPANYKLQLATWSMYVRMYTVPRRLANKSGIMMIRSSQKKREREEEGSRAVDS
jgi:hypothetical protein